MDAPFYEFPESDGCIADEKFGQFLLVYTSTGLKGLLQMSGCGACVLPAGHHTAAEAGTSRLAGPAFRNEDDIKASLPDSYGSSKSGCTTSQNQNIASNMFHRSSSVPVIRCPYYTILRSK